MLGTIRYMSPEQARGETVDARTDVFSLGVVLHEMLTGRTPFHRESARETLAAILEAVPTALPEQIPAVLQQLVTSALCKDREQRWQTAEKFAASLRESVEELQFSARLAVTGKSTWGRWQRWVGGLLVVITLAAVASYFAAQRRAVAPLTDPAQLQMNLIADWKAEPEEANAAASVAPDEQTIAFTKGENGQVDLYLKPLRNGDAVRLTNDAWRDAQPLWSPDGKQLIYVSTRNDQHEIWRISSQGGQAELVTVLNQSFLVLLRWSQDEKRIFYLTECDLCALDLQTKATFRLTNFDRRKCKISEMALSQDERWIAYAEDTNGTRQIWAMDALQLGMPIQVSREGEANLTPLWHPDGKRIIYRCKRAGVWQLCAGYLNGEPATQLTFGHENLTPWHIARDGKRILYRTERNTAALFRYDLSRGDETRISSGQQLELSPALAPDGQTVAYQQADSAMNLMNSTIQVTDNHGTQTAQLEANAFDPRWSPQQDKLAFLRPQSGRWSLWTMNRDGSEAQAVVKEGVFSGSYSPQPFHWLFPPAYSWSPTGDRLAYVTRPANISNVWTINRDGSHAENVTANTDAMAVFQSPFWSPDGSRLIYLATRNVSGPRDWNLMSAAADQRHNHYRSDRRLRLLGWLPNGDQLIFANAGAAVSSPITDVQLSKIELANNAITPVAFLSAAYLSSLLLAPDARQAAFTRHINGRDELWTISLTDGRAEKLRAREEPFVYFAGLAWSPDSRSIYFSKQSTAIALWAIDNFR